MDYAKTLICTACCQIVYVPLGEVDAEEAEVKMALHIPKCDSREHDELDELWNLPT